MIRKVREENLKLEAQVLDLEAVIQRMKLQNNMIVRAHKAGMRVREKREIGLIILVASSIMIYVVFALMTRNQVLISSNHHHMSSLHLVDSVAKIWPIRLEALWIQSDTREQSQQPPRMIAWCFPREDNAVLADVVSTTVHGRQC
jgi:hypothetical protein